MHIAEKLKRARVRLELSQSQAAKKWGVNVRTLQTWEQRKRQPRGLARVHLEQLLNEALQEGPQRPPAKPKPTARQR